MKKRFLFLFIFLIIAGVVLYLLSNNTPGIYVSQGSNGPVEKNVNINQFTSPTDEQQIISEPINNALTRITKKPFGIKISPEQSPIIPERFSGYHTGVDFETFPAEQDLDVTIYAICSGSLIFKQFVSGYGGVAVQRCKIDNNDVTVIYGHLKLSSISINLNENLEPSQYLAILGQGFSAETDKERKHLHLGIHKGKEVDWHGYVQNQSGLDKWIDVATLLK